MISESDMNRREMIARSVVTGLLTTSPNLLAADQQRGGQITEDDTGNQWNFRMKTLGGRQFWGDVFHLQGWRIQRNVLTGHYRLLDPDDYRRAWGDINECRDSLDEIRKEKKLKPASGTGVILIHGIIRSSKSFSRLHKRLEKEGYHVIPFNYPSTRLTIADSAEYLKQVLDSLVGLKTIHIVAHSMGGLVVRALLDKHREDRFKRMVMMGVPNLGAQMADRVQELGLYKMLFGPAGQELITNGMIDKLPTPRFEFGILSGCRGNEGGYNPLVPGDDDGTVSLASTRLPGATDFVTVNSLHSFIMDKKNAIEYTVRFLETGKFRKEGVPQPILPEPANNER